MPALSKMETHTIEDVVGIHYIKSSIRNQVFLGQIISSKEIKRGEIILKTKWSDGSNSNVDLKDFRYCYKGKEITNEYQNSIIATKLIKEIADYNNRCNSEDYCIGYVRTSGKKDLEHECSIRKQLLNIVEFAKSRNLKIHDILIHNKVSGGPIPGKKPHLRNYGTPYNLSLKSFEIFMGNFTILNGNIDPNCWKDSKDYFSKYNIKSIYVTSIDRLTRSVHGFRMIYEFCKYSNISINCGLINEYNNPPLVSRIDRNKMMTLALDAELYHMNCCNSAQIASNTRKRNRDIDEQNPEATEDINDLQEAMQEIEVDERPHNRQRRSHSEPPIRQSTNTSNFSSLSNAVSSVTYAAFNVASSLTTGFSGQ